MSEKWKIVTVLGILIFIIIGVYFSIEQARQLTLPEAIDNINTEQTSRDMQAEQILHEAETTVYSKDEVMKWVLCTEVLEKYQEQNEVLLTGVQGEGFENDVQIYELSAQEGKLNKNSGDMTFIGDIYLYSPSTSTVLTAEELYWDGTQQYFQAAGNVVLIQNGMKITGNILTADRNLETIMFDDDVKALYKE